MNCRVWFVPARLTCKGRSQDNTLDAVCVFGHTAQHIFGATKGWLNELFLGICDVSDERRSCVENIISSLKCNLMFQLAVYE